MGSSKWSLNDLKAKGFTVQGNKAVKTVEIKHKGNVVATATSMNEGAWEPEKPIIKVSGGIFIPRNVPSSKNSRQLAIVNGKPRSFESKLCAKYRTETKTWYIQQAEHFKRMVAQRGLKKPLHIQFYFVRTSKLRFDHHNAVQLVMDLMTEHGWVPDDNANEIVAVPPEGQVYHVDKKNAGVYIIV